MNIALLIVTSLTLLVAIVDLVVDLRHARPQRKRAVHQDLARTFVAAAQQRGGEGPDKKRWAIERLMEHGLKNTQAEAFVEHAVAEFKKK